MARITLPAPDEAAQTPAAETPPPLLSIARIAMLVRIITLVFLVLTVSLLGSNSTTIKLPDSTSTFDLNDVYAYQYALATAVIGSSYTIWRLRYSIKQLKSGIFHVTDPKILFYEFLADKVVVALVATGVGAAFAATVELKTKIHELEDVLQVYLDTTATVFAPNVPKFDDFFNKAYFPNMFLLIALFTIGVSSLLSSLALNKTK
ncbi:CASP-like protein 4D1 [Salvia miltiorrhiza]|uniref:CASP-like protein 4D1 n=1 Tax=Salvia miltiorrhiza TaxID=226208 RepID=UPI0025AD941D|nr:CASP-like protein 4D1 [Salvia miltiorrhiza]